ncbi:ABC transporter substrate-binding protein [Pelosinus propionicus]|uniref:Iron complex transport system substrate-binding protein n=1 Tax=Pelosinus propionicus DSM 13327 TaxID=1123291 RepID=A0A1I4JDR6_9FIRM|nr:ABC transporter substrate-binding protein [Pelosinus propionicus]SFL64690.1 iron complex transport system substrate-binding protein [Pelosinus propionicus DSM 13327]
MLGYDGTVQDLWNETPAALRSVRCAFCHSMLFRGAVEKIEIKCSKCGTVQVVQRNGESLIKERDLSRNGLRRISGMQNRMVTDSMGRLVTIPSQPQRVIILNSSNLGLFIETGGEPVGRGTCEILPAALRDKIQDIPTVGLPCKPDLDRILAIKPDLVIGMAFPAHQSLAAVLERKGIPTMLQTFARYADVLEALHFYGELNGKSNVAAQKIAAIEQHRQALIEQTSGQPSPRVLIVWAIADGLYAALSTSFIGDMVKRLGGVNVADLLIPMDEKIAYAPLDYKGILAVQPDVVLVIDHRFDEKANQGIQLLHDSLWQGLHAVQQNYVYSLPFSLFAVNPGAQVEEAMNILADFLYKR